MAETSDMPIAGNVVKTKWVDDESMLAWVEHPETGEVWCETYKFEVAEKVE